MNPEFTFKLSSADPSSAEALKLTKELFDELEELYGNGRIEEFEEENKSFLYFIIVSDENDNPAGCGALKYFDPFTIEIKRMYVRKIFRGKGLSKLILQELERKAKEMNYSRIVLETGVRQPEAVNLYEKSGYRRIEAYGKYADDPESLCYVKKI
ncbi:MAG: GNAT family N-acetyltransferase [Ignavibacteria bacterium]